MVIGDKHHTSPRESIKIKNNKGLGYKKQEDLQHEAQQLGEAINNGITNINPDIIYSNIVNNFEQAKKLYGETFLRMITGYDPHSIEINLNIEEFKKELKKTIYRKSKQLQEEGLLTNNYDISEKAIKLIAAELLKQELDKLKRIADQGSIGKKQGHGEEKEIINYRRGLHYRDIATRQTIKIAAKRRHKTIDIADLRYRDRKEHKDIELLVILDTSSSMKNKLLGAKKAAIGLVHIAISENNKVGLVVFSSKIKTSITPTRNKEILINSIIRAIPSGQTNMQEAIRKAEELFHTGKHSRHVVIITDALPNVGEKPVKEVLEEVSRLITKGITISVIGIMLNKEGIITAELIARTGKGRFYNINNPEHIDLVLIRDYEELKI